MDPAKEQPWMAEIDAAVKAQRAAQLRFLSEIIRTPSDNPPGNCGPLVACSTSLLSELGLEVEQHRVPDALCRAEGVTQATNLIVRRRYGAGPTLVLNAHGDVVPPGEGWSYDPYGAEIVEGTMYGRGVAVSKSDFATYTFALLALEAAVAPTRGTLELHFTFDEETGGTLGPAWILKEGLSRPDYAIVAGFSYGVVTAHNGCLHLEVEVRGRSAHAASPESGHDALEAASAALAALYDHRRGLDAKTSAVPGIGSPNLVIGLINGGINTNVVPDRVTFRLDRRMIPEEDPAEVESELRGLIAESLAGRPGISLEIRRVLLAEPLRPLPETAALAGVLSRHATRVLGSEVTSHGVPLYADGRHYAAAGIPTVMYGAGPRNILEANAHRADERLRLDDLELATRVVALSAAELLDPDGTATTAERARP